MDPPACSPIPKDLISKALSLRQLNILLLTIRWHLHPILMAIILFLNRVIVQMGCLLTLSIHCHHPLLLRNHLHPSKIMCKWVPRLSRRCKRRMHLRMPHSPFLILCPFQVGTHLQVIYLRFQSACRHCLLLSSRCLLYPPQMV